MGYTVHQYTDVLVPGTIYITRIQYCMGEIWRTFFVYLDYSTGKAVLADPESNNVLHDIHYFIISILIYYLPILHVSSLSAPEP